MKKVLVDLQRKPLYMPGYLVGMEERVQAALTHIHSNTGGSDVKVISLYSQ